jgi:hypothetical protein
LNTAAYGETYPGALPFIFTLTDRKPHAKLRIGIKDIIGLKGLRVRSSSRANTQLYGLQTDNVIWSKDCWSKDLQLLGKQKPPSLQILSGQLKTM